jgi:glutathione peroxidase
MIPVQATFAIALAAVLAGCTPTATPAKPEPTASSTPAKATETSSMTFYSFEAAPLGATEKVSLSKYKGTVLLVVNTAAHCGYTPQYTPLGEVDRKYGTKGFKVLGFVSDDFGHQGGSTEEVKSCSLEHKATFDQFATVGVKKGDGQHPLFAWLTTQPGKEGEAKWNFNKWLIGKKGELLARWPSDTAPDGSEISKAIEAALAAP